MPFLLGWLVRHPRRLITVSRLPFVWLYSSLTRKPRAYLKEAALTAFMAGAKRAEIEPYVCEFWRDFLPYCTNEEIMSRIRWHHESGHAVYIVTSSFDFYVNHLAALLPIDGVIATRAAWRGDVLTGKIDGKDCSGVVKMERIERELGVDLQSVCYYAYSDRESDLPLLLNTQHGFLVSASTTKPWIS